MAAALVLAAAPAAPADVTAAALPAERARALEQALREIVATTSLRSARTSILVEDLESGQVVYARDPDVLLNPASNVKLFTSAAVLARLGPEYRFATEALSDVAPSAGTVRTLYVRGRGDPTFTTERLWLLASDLVHRGVRTVKGDLVVDDGWFDAEREGPGYDQEQGDRAYLAPVGALSLNWNAVAIHVSPGARPGDRGRVEVEPESAYLDVENRTRTVRAGELRRASPRSFRLTDGRQRIVVEGRLPAGGRDQVFHRRIEDPPAYFGATLKRLLQLRGVTVKGQVRRGEVPAGAHLLVVSQSEPLGQIVRRLEKTSNNFVAEQLLKALGAERLGPPGTWPKGVAAVEEFLAEVGLPRGSYVMRNGSGLNDANRFSARQTVALLRDVWRRFPIMADFLAALPIAGRDGTTRLRMEGSEGRLRAKTGTLDGVSSLSGYVETAAHERLAFSIIVNDVPGRLHATVAAVDALGLALAAAGGEELGAAVAAAQPPAPGLAAASAEAPAELRARLATYHALGRAADPRNVAFLRRAVRAEADPVLRMAAGEALHLSDPESDGCQRAFVETVPADPAALARLRALGEGLDPAPVLPSLADLAAAGSTEALARLVDVTPALAADPAAAPELAALWADVARNAPGELVRALQAAPTAPADAALGFMARGIAHAQEPGHPLPEAVALAAGDPDPALAAFARALAARLEEQLAAARAVEKAGPPDTIGPPRAAGTPPAPTPTPTPTSAPAPAAAEARATR